MGSLINDNRRDERQKFPSDWHIKVLGSASLKSIDGVNISCRGACLRTGTPMEINTQLQLRMEHRQSTLKVGKAAAESCLARVAWVQQRLDLRDTPPFVFDIGIEWVNEPARLIRSLFGDSPADATGMPAGARRLVKPWSANGREYSATLIEDLSAQVPWHLVIRVDGAPCLSRRFDSERAATNALRAFKKELEAGASHAN